MKHLFKDILISPHLVKPGRLDFFFLGEGGGGVILSQLHVLEVFRYGLVKKRINSKTYNYRWSLAFVTFNQKYIM